MVMWRLNIPTGHDSLKVTQHKLGQLSILGDVGRETLHFSEMRKTSLMIAQGSYKFILKNLIVNLVGQITYHLLNFVKDVDI